MTIPDKFCDLVMKGGITSGVVYPLAIYELSKSYRFQNIGGASAGAIAAVVTAAAEHGRQAGGFEKIKALPHDLSKTLLEKFHPTPEFARLFQLMLSILRGGRFSIVKSLVANYWERALLGALPGAALVVYGLFSGDWGFGLLGASILVLLSLGLSAYAAFTQFTRGLPDANYGMCPGTSQPGFEGEALSEWMARTIDDVAGLDEECDVPESLHEFTSARTYKKPLTIGDLADKDIAIATVTTDITTHRPYKLPMDNNLHFFNRREFLQFFPERVVLHMCATGAPVSTNTVENPEGDLYYFQNEADLPLVVLARMSLSFPILFTTVPLYRCDYTFKSADERRRPVKCHFSDGGISSNFPVQFFDQFLPHTPTFGIALSEIDSRRFTDAENKAIRHGTEDPGLRVKLPTDAADGQLLPTQSFRGMGGFLMAMFNSAKDWQDSLQSILTGYRERIVTLSLKESEGGLNLEMEEEKILKLTSIGKAAGEQIVSDFDLDEHRWRRLLVEMSALERLLSHFAENFQSDVSEKTFADLAISHKSGAYSRISDRQREMIRSRAESLANLCAVWADEPNIRSDKAMPRTRSSARNIAEMGE